MGALIAIIIILLVIEFGLLVYNLNLKCNLRPLIKTNKNVKENISIVGLLYGIGVIAGIILELFL